MSTLKKKYDEEFVPSVVKEGVYANRMAVPRLTKITINMGLGEAVHNPKLIDMGIYILTRISGQKPVVTRSKFAISNFKLRENVSIGVMVTLRRKRMYEFLERLIVAAIPRVRDFKGLSPKSFDGRGSYTFGIKECLVFPEIDYDKIEKIKGMNITIGTNAYNDADARRLLKGLGFPFRN